MKIQRKQSEEILEVEAETKHWFVGRSGLTYSKEDYEKVATPRWKNVTHEIHVVEPNYKISQSDEGEVYHEGTCIAKLCCGGKYRLKLDGPSCCIEKWEV